MERRLSLILAAAGLLAALGILLLGRRTSPDELRAAAADLDASVRETAAAVKERADTIAQLPRIGLAVGTDEATVRDLTNEELAFRTHPGEHIEITQMHRDGGDPHRLLRLPPGSDLDLPLIPGTHVVVRDDHLQLVTVVDIEPRERAETVTGRLAVAKQLDTAAITQRLDARRISAVVRTTQGSFVLAGTAPAAGADTTAIRLTGPAAAGIELVAANVSAARWPRVVAPLILILSIAGAGFLWRRAGATAAQIAQLEPRFRRPQAVGPPAVLETPSEPVTEPAPTPQAPPPALAPPPRAPAPPPPVARSATPVPRSATPAPGARPTSPTPLEPRPARLPTPVEQRPARLPTPPEQRPARLPTPSGSQSRPVRLPTPSAGARPHRPPTPPPAPKTTPVVGMAKLPEDAVPTPIDSPSDLAHSGRVDYSMSHSMTRTGSVPMLPPAAVPPSALFGARQEGDPRTEEYRSLFAEFVKLRRTTGESVDDLDPAHFVETLVRKRAQIMKQIPVKDVQFQLAFQNGKAAIRYRTVT